MGAHIRCLLLMLYLIYMPKIIEAGLLYAVIPPLYGIKGRGNQTRYFTTTPDYLKYVQSGFLSKHMFTDINNKKISNNQALSIFYNNRDYLDEITEISDTFAIDPDLLESTLYELAPYIEFGSDALISNMAAAKKVTPKKKKTEKKEVLKSSDKIAIDEDSEEIEIEIPVTENSVMGVKKFFTRPEFNVKNMIKNLKKKYRFLEADVVNGTLVLGGLVNSKRQTVFVNDKFISTCLNLINTIKNNDEYYKVDGFIVTIYGLMNMLKAEEPKGINRYKGLGEQNPSQLKISTMDPNGDRSRVRYTIESAKEEIEKIRHIESNMYSLLREIKVNKNEVE